MNRNFQYQLIRVGGYAPVYIAQEVSRNRFQISGGQPGLKVSWQVTGIRQDASANRKGLVVAVNKLASERGRYLGPRAFGLAKSTGFHRLESETIQ